MQKNEGAGGGREQRYVEPWGKWEDQRKGSRPAANNKSTMGSVPELDKEGIMVRKPQGVYKGSRAEWLEEKGENKMGWVWVDMTRALWEGYWR